MLAIAFGVIWAGYGLASYAEVLRQGWDIPFSSWFSPVHTYEFPRPPEEPPKIPNTQVNPSGPGKPHKQAKGPTAAAA